MNTKSKLALLAAALISSTSLAAPSRAGLWEAAVTRTETVRFKAHSATTTEGAAALYAKLQEAAVRVCADSDSLTLLADPTALENCVTDALTGAVQNVGIPMVSALHIQAGQKPAAIVAR